MPSLQVRNCYTFKKFKIGDFKFDFVVSNVHEDTHLAKDMLRTFIFTFDNKRKIRITETYKPGQKANRVGMALRILKIENGECIGSYNTARFHQSFDKSLLEETVRILVERAKNWRFAIEEVFLSIA